MGKLPLDNSENHDGEERRGEERGGEGRRGEERRGEERRGEEKEVREVGGIWRGNQMMARANLNEHLLFSFLGIFKLFSSCVDVLTEQNRTS